MANTRSRWIVICCVLAIALCPNRARPVESDQLLATVNKPATVTARVPSSEGATEKLPPRARVIISVTNYRPTDDGTPVEVVVKGRTGDGEEREVGRFGITPDREFNAAEPSAALRFNLALPQELTTKEPVKFSIHLVANKGQGKGAALRVGSIEIR